MREIVLDVETTGMNKKRNNDINTNHRIIEIGCVEIINKKKTDKKFYALINPEQKIDFKATEIHGISDDDVKDAPKFKDIAGELINFMKGANIIIHNASFDIKFIDSEFDKLPKDQQPKGLFLFTDTLEIARDMNLNCKKDLDSLSLFFDVKRERKKHGGLVDAEILCDIYLKMLSM